MLLLAGRVVVGQGIALMLVSLVYAVSLILGTPDNRALALVGAAAGIVLGALLTALGRALGRGRRASASPVVLTELLAVPVGIGLAQGAVYPAAVAVLVPALAVLGLLFGTADGRSVFRE